MSTNINLLNRVNVLFSNVDATAIEMWATTDIPMSALQPASIIMVTPENHDHCPWLLIKYGDVVHTRSLNCGIREVIFDHPYTPKANALCFEINGATVQIYLLTPTIFWCFMHIATGSHFDSEHSAGLTEETLMDAWKDFTVPGNFILQCSCRLPSCGDLRDGNFTLYQ
ncbi:hypothetical protein C8R48DRAFT_680469 [Suillus tomentosus]|nr:hypothetical protein C8R48DRAFT_680469 [Suillus tomentosus]